MSVKILPDDVVSKIAAGEVIESPVSVLKELIENSIDAESSDIIIEIKKSGKELIRVVDNGNGMSENDLKLSIHRHATSKINTVEDLYRVNSYGFRGEALFSIFSVSKLKILTYNGYGDTGYTLEGEGGNFEKIKVYPSPPVKGTSVEVRDIFFNTPARKKFLKSDNYIRSQIIRLVEEFALVKPNIRFRLVIDGREIYNFAGEQDFDKGVLNRLSKIFSDKIARDLIRVENSFDFIKIYGYISSPSNLVSSKAHQFIFVNNRIVDSRLINSAVYKAYESFRDTKHPAYVIFIDVSGDKLDVNIHPQKKEVRFQDESFVYSAVYKSIYNSVVSYQMPKRVIEYDESNSDYIRENLSENVEFVSEREFERNIYTQSNFLNHIYNSETKPLWYKPPIKYIGQVFSSILVFQTNSSILLVDQHAAVERIMYEKYLDEFSKELVKTQELIMPVEIKIQKSVIDRVESISEWLKKAGFTIGRRGVDRMVVYSVPHIFEFNPQALEELFTYLADVFLKFDSIAEDLKKDTIASLACKKSIKFKDFVDEKSAVKILEDLKDAKDPLHCPHGRPTVLEITYDELIKKFGRTSV